jgi:DNA-binding CsgD family transcriptional regulator
LLSLIFIVVFIFCLATAIAAIWISRQSIGTYNTDFHKDYFYYLVNFYAFAFYGIWAQILMRALLSRLDTDHGIVAVAANFLPVLGVPFLCISWIMLVKMGYSLTEMPVKRKVLGFLIIFFVGIVPLMWGLYIVFYRGDWFHGEQLTYAEMGLMLFIEMASMILFAGFVLPNSKKYKKTKRKIVNRFVMLMLLAFALRSTALPFLLSRPWFVAPIVLLYFLSNFVPAFYLKLNSDVAFVPVYAGRPNEQKKALLCKKYGITKREKEIVDGICEGKTNQQIADQLFISLQTVKDHTHRIYSKIGINSRMKLVQLVKG